MPIGRHKIKFIEPEYQRGIYKIQFFSNNKTIAGFSSMILMNALFIEKNEIIELIDHD